MKTIYSILYLSLNPTLNEKVSIGLLMTNGIETVFSYSSEKLNATNKLIDKGAFSLAKSYLMALEKDINKVQKNQILFQRNEQNADWVNVDYITYLSQYANNLITFSQPKTIDIEFNRENYNLLFEKYVFPISKTQEEKSKPITTIYKKVSEVLYPKIKERVNLDIKLKPEQLDNLYTSIEINVFGKNERPMSAQMLDFEKMIHYLENDISRYVSFTKAVNLTEKKEGTYFIIGKEPSKKQTENHVLWNQIRSSKFLEYVDVSEVEKIEEYVEKHEVTPFMEVKE